MRDWERTEAEELHLQLKVGGWGMKDAKEGGAQMAQSLRTTSGAITLAASADLGKSKVGGRLLAVTLPERRNTGTGTTRAATSGPQGDAASSPSSAAPLCAAPCAAVHEPHATRRCGLAAFPTLCPHTAHERSAARTPCSCSLARQRSHANAPTRHAPRAYTPIHPITAYPSRRTTHGHESMHGYSPPMPGIRLTREKDGVMEGKENVNEGVEGGGGKGKHGMGREGGRVSRERTAAKGGSIRLRVFITATWLGYGGGVGHRLRRGGNQYVRVERGAQSASDARDVLSSAGTVEMRCRMNRGTTRAQAGEAKIGRRQAEGALIS
ncbi:hypothetical protein C8R47DRAFT_1196495 [Mycena vitilis]|nr:hypothetical protein C8R47DRAFT_1196495 [Mycena vitilis]